MLLSFFYYYYYRILLSCFIIIVIFVFYLSSFILYFIYLSFFTIRLKALFLGLKSGPNRPRRRSTGRSMAQAAAGPAAEAQLPGQRRPRPAAAPQLAHLSRVHAAPVPRLAAAPFFSSPRWSPRLAGLPPWLVWVLHEAQSALTFPHFHVGPPHWLVWFFLHQICFAFSFIPRGFPPKHAICCFWLPHAKTIPLQTVSHVSCACRSSLTVHVIVVCSSTAWYQSFPKTDERGITQKPPYTPSLAL